MAEPITVTMLRKLGACEDQIAPPSEFAEYNRALNSAWAKYKRTLASALDDRNLSWAEFRRVAAPAWVEYERTMARAFAELYIYGETK